MLLQKLLQLLQRRLLLLSLPAQLLLQNSAPLREGGLPPRPLLPLGLKLAFPLFPPLPFSPHLFALFVEFCVERVPTLLLLQGALHG
jgi:hypothetical protein